MSKNDGPAASSFLEPSKAGWLTKHGGSGIKGNWKKRWFVLDHHYLFYYESAKDKHPKGIICLPDYKDCRRAEKTECQKKNSLTLIPDPDLVEPGTTSRTYYMYGESEDECGDWIHAILKEMRPTVGIRKPQDRSKSLPDSSKAKTASVKVNKKDLDVVTTAATGGPQLTHLTKERAQGPKKKRPPRKFKPMDEDDDPVPASPVKTLEESWSSQPNARASPSETAPSPKAAPSPKTSVKKPVLPPTNSKLKLDIVGGINQETRSSQMNVKAMPPAPPPKIYKELEPTAVGELKDATGPTSKESATNDIADTTSVGILVSPLKSPTIDDLVTKPKPLREQDNEPTEATNGKTPTPPPSALVNNDLLTKPRPSKQPANESSQSNDGNVTASPLPDDPSSTKPRTSSTKELTESLPTTPKGNRPSTKPKPPNTPVKQPAESLDTTDNDALPSPLAAVTEKIQPPSKPKSPEVDDGNVHTPTKVMSTGSRPFTKPRPPAKHPRPKASASSTTNQLVTSTEETKESISASDETKEKAQPITEIVHIVEDKEKAAEDKTTEKVSTPEKSASKELKGKSKTNNKAAVLEIAEKEENITKVETVIDKVSAAKSPVPNRPKPKPRVSKSDITTNVPVANAAAIDTTLQEEVASIDVNEKVEEKPDADMAEKLVEADKNLVDQTKVAVESKETDTTDSAQEKLAIVEDVGDALYSVVDLCSSRSKDGETIQKSKETSPKYHDYDFVSISPRPTSLSPEEEDPGYDVIGDVTVVKKEPLSAKDSSYDNWKLKKLPGKTKPTDDIGPEYAVIDIEPSQKNVTNGSLSSEVPNPMPGETPVTVSVAASTIPQYAAICKKRKSTKNDESLHLDGQTAADDNFDALFEHLGSSIPAHLSQAKEIMRLAQVVRQEAEQLKKEATEDREAARRDRMEAEQMKRNAAEILKLAKERAA